jgi:X-X-X-Leu-X-X-Gly heptad repeat protein
MKVQRLALTLLLLVSMLPVANFANGYHHSAWADDGLAADAASAGTAARSGTDAAVAGRDEVVYALLAGDGSPKAGYVVNHIQVERAGGLREFGDYDSLENLSTTAAIGYANGQLTVPVEAGEFYYEGVINAVELPWLVDVAYRLDGRQVDTDALAGASGKLEVEVQTRANPQLDPVFFDNYVLQVQLTLDAAKAKGIVATDATIASVGKNQQVVFTVLPGKQGRLQMQAQVTDFEMPGIQISALPFNMAFDLPDSSGMVADMETLSDAINELNKGISQLKDGTGDLSSGLGGLADGSAKIKSGLVLLSQNSAGLSGASAQINSALAEIDQQLQAGAIDPNQIVLLTDGLRQLSAGLSSNNASQPGLAEGLSQIQAGIDASVQAMDSQISALSVVGAGEIGALYAELSGLPPLSPASQQTVASLVGVNTQAAYIQGAWYGPGGNDGVMAGLQSASAGLGGSITACQTMASQLTLAADALDANLGSLAGLQQLGIAINQLATSYSGFNDGLVSYIAGVDGITTSYTDFDSGLSQTVGGIQNLYSGAGLLQSGSSELYQNVKDLPQSVQKQIDEFTKDYRRSDFEPASFVSKANQKTERVQFVLLTDPVKKPEPEKPSASDAPAEPSFWDKLVSLF